MVKYLLLGHNYGSVPKILPIFVSTSFHKLGWNSSEEDNMCGKSEQYDNVYIRLTLVTNAVSKSNHPHHSETRGSSIDGRHPTKKTFN